MPPKDKDPFAFDVPTNDGLRDDLSFGNESAGDDGVDLLGNYAPDDAGLDEVDDDLSVTYAEDTAVESQKVLGQMAQAQKDAGARIKAATNYDFFLCVVFISQEQRDEFVRRTGWDDHGGRYVNGVSLAKAMGIELPPSDYQPPAREKADRALSELALDI